ncbi:Wnt4p [Cichlidogyrus casuarinus]|uniref:Protein Wnt n=1 Tax=Cichlidogyrus casuarinus TaxID=1844966 RepID=A0ABD2Q4X4_9PLAT
MLSCLGLFFISSCWAMILAEDEDLELSSHSLYNNRNGLRQTLANQDPNDAIFSGNIATSEGNPINTGDFTYVPYPASDIVAFKTLAPSYDVPLNPNQSPTYTPLPTLSDLVDQGGQFSRALCNQSHLFVGEQAKICNSFLALMPSLVRGYAAGIAECEFQFRNEKWNCKGHNHTVTVPNRRWLYRARRNMPVNQRVHTYMDRLLARS